MDIYDNIKKGKYETKMEGEVLSCYICPDPCGTRYQIHSKATIRFCPNCGQPVKEFMDKIIETNKAIKLDYRKREAIAMNRFKEDLLKYCEVEDNPKRDKAYSYAWEHGHSSGLYEVANVMVDIVDLIK